jgi:hypothetical protein
VIASVILFICLSMATAFLITLRRNDHGR